MSPNSLLPRLMLYAALACVLAATGCAGYQFAGQEHGVLSGQAKSLAFKDVDNPTLETWLEPRLRADIRDELARRGLADWTSTSKAETLLTIKVLHYTTRAKVKNRSDETIKYFVELSIEATLTGRETGAPVWNSGPVTRQESYLEGELPDAREKVVDFAVRELADRMAHAF